jgi:hypothetical protein
MKRRTLPRGVLALLLTVSLTAPSAAALACGPGDACCADMGMVHTRQQAGDAMAVPGMQLGCPMMGACTLTAPATIPQVATSAVARPHLSAAALPTVMPYRSFIGTPVAPPPKA